MLKGEEKITTLIPHRSPFVQVDSLIRAEDNFFVTEFTILSDNILVKEGLFQESGMLENIAQSVAAGFGYIGKKSGREPKAGYIGAISRVTVLQLPKAGDTITTRVQITHRLDPVVMVHGTCHCGQVKLLEGEIKLVLNE